MRMRNKRWTPFCLLPRRKRRDSFIRLRQKIRNESWRYGGEFTTHHILDEPGRPALYNQWADAYFLDSDGLTIWNATFITAAREFWDRVEEMAHARAWKMLTREEQIAETEMIFDPIWSHGQRMYQLREMPKIVHEKFGGLTYHEYQDKLVDKIIQDEPPEVCESFTTDRSFRYGVGLQVVIHVDEISKSSIEEAIRRFREIGETDWRATKPVPRDELPAESANAAFSKVRWEPDAVPAVNYEG